MKSSHLTVILSLIVAFTVVSAAIVRVEAMAQRDGYIRYAGVGPAVAEGVDVDKLPLRARDFIAHHMRDCEVAHVDREFDSGSYEVWLTDGVEIEFSAKGDFGLIEAPEGYVLTQSLVREIVPAKCYKSMVEMGFAANVESIEVDSSGYSVSFAGVDVDSALYDMTGRMMAMYD